MSKNLIEQTQPLRCINVLQEVYSKMQHPIDRLTIKQLIRQLEEQCILPNSVPCSLKEDAIYGAYNPLISLDQAFKRLNQLTAACNEEAGECRDSCFRKTKYIEEKISEIKEKSKKYLEESLGL